MVGVRELRGLGGEPALIAHGPNAGGMFYIGATRRGEIVMKHSRHPTGGLLVSRDGGSPVTPHALRGLTFPLESVSISACPDLHEFVKEIAECAP